MIHCFNNDPNAIARHGKQDCGANDAHRVLLNPCSHCAPHLNNVLTGPPVVEHIHILGIEADRQQGRTLHHADIVLSARSSN